MKTKYCFIEQSYYNSLPAKIQQSIVSVSNGNKNTIATANLSSKDWYVFEVDYPEALKTELVNHELLEEKDAQDVINSGVYSPSYSPKIYNFESIRLESASPSFRFNYPCIEIETSNIDSLYCKQLNPQNYSLTDRPGITARFLKWNGSSYVDCSNQLDADITCKITVVDVEFQENFEMAGGAIFTINEPAVPTRVFIHIAPDIPAIAGGSIEFAAGVNHQFLQGKTKQETDGQTVKYFKYDPVYHTSKFRFTFDHRNNAGAKTKFMIALRRYVE